MNYRDRSGRTVPGDNNHGDWLAPAFAEMFRVLEDDAFCVSFYGWSKVDKFFAAWTSAGFRPVGHFRFAERTAPGHEQEAAERRKRRSAARRAIVERDRVGPRCGPRSGRSCVSTSSWDRLP